MKNIFKGSTEKLFFQEYLIYPLTNMLSSNWNLEVKKGKEMKDIFKGSTEKLLFQGYLIYLLTNILSSNWDLDLEAENNFNPQVSL